MFVWGMIAILYYSVLQYCRDMGGYLLEIDNEAEQQLIEHLVPMDSGVAYWIGLQRRPGGK